MPSLTLITMLENAPIFVLRWRPRELSGAAAERRPGRLFAIENVSVSPSGIARGRRERIAGAGDDVCGGVPPITARDPAALEPGSRRPGAAVKVPSLTADDDAREVPMLAEVVFP